MKIDEDNCFSCIPNDFNVEKITVTESSAISAVVTNAIQVNDVISHLAKYEASSKIALLHWPVSWEPTSLRTKETVAVLQCLEILRSAGHTNVRLVPSVVRLKCQLVESMDLVERSRLALPDVGEEFSSIHCGANLNPMNEYRAHHVHGLSENNFKYITLSNPFDLFSFHIDEDTFPPISFRVTRRISSTNFGIGTAILYWLEVADDFGNILAPKVFIDVNKTQPSFRLTDETDEQYTVNEACMKFSAFVLNEYFYVEPDSAIEVITSIYHDNIIFDSVHVTNLPDANPAKIVDELIRRRSGCNTDALRRLVAEAQRHNSSSRK